MLFPQHQYPYVCELLLYGHECFGQSCFSSSDVIRQHSSACAIFFALLTSLRGTNSHPFLTSQYSYKVTKARARSRTGQQAHVPPLATRALPPLIPASGPAPSGRACPGCRSLSVLNPGAHSNTFSQSMSAYALTSGSAFHMPRDAMKCRILISLFGFSVQSPALYAASMIRNSPAQQ